MTASATAAASPEDPARKGSAMKKILSVFVGIVVGSIVALTALQPASAGTDGRLRDALGYEDTNKTLQTGTFVSVRASGVVTGVQVRASAVEGNTIILGTLTNAASAVYTTNRMIGHLAATTNMVVYRAGLVVSVGTNIP